MRSVQGIGVEYDNIICLAILDGPGMIIIYQTSWYPISRCNYKYLNSLKVQFWNTHDMNGIPTDIKANGASQPLGFVIMIDLIPVTIQ